MKDYVFFALLTVLVVSACTQEDNTVVYEAIEQNYLLANEAKAPGKLAIYRGWPSLVNGVNDPQSAISTFADYDVIVFGRGLEFPQHDPNDTNSIPSTVNPCLQNSHGDHDNAAIVIRGLVLNGKEVFGSIVIGGAPNTKRRCDGLPISLTAGEIESKVDAWKAMGVTGIFFDEAGYDFWTSRETKLRYRICPRQATCCVY